MMVETPTALCPVCMKRVVASEESTAGPLRFLTVLAHTASCGVRCHGSPWNPTLIGKDHGGRLPPELASRIQGDPYIVSWCPTCGILADPSGAPES